MDINPNPPISINSIITICPNNSNVSLYLLVTSPVTHTAEVDVNKASKKLVDSPLTDEYW